jgi:hypothetical protein
MIFSSTKRAAVATATHFVIDKLGFQIERFKKNE